MLLENKVAVITGGAQGTGYAVAENFLREKAKVLIADIDTKIGIAAEKRLRKIGTAKFIHCNVAEKLDVHNLVASALDEFTKIDILVNNAVHGVNSSFLDTSEEAFDQAVAVNLKGVFLCSQAIVRHMLDQIERGELPGSIINLSSGNAIFAPEDQTRHLNWNNDFGQLTKIMSHAFAKHGIRVNAIDRGCSRRQETVADNSGVDAKSAFPATAQQISRQSKDAFCEIAALATFLASDKASYITGQTICTDGGRSVFN